MRETVIENPVINSAFTELHRHFKFDDDGITSDIVEQRRSSAYFTPVVDEPHKELQRALKAEIDEAAWSTLSSTVSRPFDLSSTGKITVKVINHYGGEVLKVYMTLRSQPSESPER